MSAPYRPGQPQQWPDPRQRRPDRPPPIQFQQQGEPRRPKNTALAWVLRGAGLVVIAVVSGLVWYYITNDDTTNAGTGDQTSEEQPQGRYQLTPYSKMPNPNTDENCADHAYGDIQKFLQTTQCDHLSRQLFVAKVDGRSIYTSVSVVTMPDEAKAAELRELTDKDGSGNVSDVIRDGLVKIDGMDRLSRGGGYASSQSGRDVIIVEADFDPKDKSGDEKADEKNLDNVCEDALRLGPQIADFTG